MFNFDLQMFAEEAANGGTEATTNTDIAETSADTDPSAADGGQQEEKPPIPEELAGLDEDIAREVMNEAESLQQQGADNTEDRAEDNITLVTTPKGNIPYSRFKEKVDETNNLKAQLEAYKKKFGDIAATGQGQPSPQPTTNNTLVQGGEAHIMQTVNVPSQQQPMPLQITPEITAELNKYCKAQAMQMTGMTEEDVESIPYMEDEDPRKAQYDAALKMAEANAYARIQQAQQQEMARREAFLRQHNASVASYNEFVKREMAEPDHKQIVAYAVGDYLAKASPADQTAVSVAYERVERNVASPQDIMLVKQFYSAAKAAYRRGNGNRGKANNNNKGVNANAFPRSLQVDGASDSGGNIDPAALEKMLDTTPWDKIPKHIQDLLKGV